MLGSLPIEIIQMILPHLCPSALCRISDVNTRFNREAAARKAADLTAFVGKVNELLHADTEHIVIWKHGCLLRNWVRADPRCLRIDVHDTFNVKAFERLLERKNFNLFTVYDCTKKNIL